MESDTARDFLANVVKEVPFPENEYEADYLRKHMARYRDSCDLIAANCPSEGRLLSVGCEPGHIEILLVERRKHKLAAGWGKRFFLANRFICATTASIQTRKFVFYCMEPGSK